MTCKIKIGGKNDKYAIVDEKFYPVLSKYSWSLNRHDYVFTHFKCEHMRDLNKKRGTLFMHQMVMTLSHDFRNICLCDTSYMLAEPQLTIDHKNADTLDNRIDNLRYETGAFNKSKGGLRKGQSSKYNGVCWSKRDKKWLARCKTNGKKKHIGLFDDEIEAARAFDAKCVELNLDRMLNFRS